MDQNSEVIDSFESVLKQRSTVRPTTLYYNIRNRNISDTTSNQKLNAQSIISQVANQIKAIQSSEAVGSGRRPVVNMDRYRNSSFLPLNELQERVPPRPPEPQKFDTQLFSNTQLINVVEDAEALDVNIGMTQEFETTFLCSQDNELHHKQIHEEKNLGFPILDISLKEPDPKLIPITNENEKEIDCNCVKSNEDPELLAEIDTLIDVSIQGDEADDKYEDIYDVEDLGAIEHDREELENLQAPLSQLNYTQKPPSPVFNVKSKKPMSDFESPLVFDLEVFENFENIAMPIVEVTPDLEQARFLINSQIAGDELVIHTYMADTEPLSPIIEISDHLLKINKRTITCKDNKDVAIGEKQNIHDIEDYKSNEYSQSDKSIFQDEILFSSDEEEAYHQRSYKDLPFTCALETSFYEENEVLDKTMYVGFQTASNKSIQIGTESFSKAKNWLDSLTHDLKNEGTITELVEICDTKNSGTTDVNTIANIAHTTPVDDNVDALDKINTHSSFGIEIPSMNNSSVKNILLEDKNILLDNATITVDCKFEGFKTASNKPIQPSKEALIKYKKIFESIDLDSNMSKNVELPEDVVKHDVIEEQSIDEDIIREFQEDLMHGELEHILNVVESDIDPIIKNNEIINGVENVGFKTANNKKINISDAALAKSKKLFQDIDLTEELDTVEHSSANYLKTTSNIGFKTASNKNITISEEALIKTKQVFNSIVLNDDDVDFKNLCKKYKDSDCNQLEMKKFNNICHNPLTCDTNHTQDREKNKQNGEANEIIVFENENKFAKSKSVEAETKVSGFKTIDSKKVLISSKSITGEGVDKDGEMEPPFFGFDINEEYVEMVEETLEKSQQILKKLTQYDKINVKVSDLANTQLAQNISNEFLNKNKDPNKLSPGCTRFQTASNKEDIQKISEKALAKTRRTLQDLDEDKSLEIINNKTHFDFKFKGFQTASNKNIKISESALAKSRQIFQDINDSKSLKENLDEVYPDTKFKGFQTTSHKELKISDEALARSKKIFQNINDDTLATTNKKKEEGFKTASNKQICIPEKALEKSLKLFQNISEDKLLEETTFNDPRRTRENIEVDLKFKGFHTASNKKINISEKALVNSRKIFKDISDIESTVTNSDYLRTKRRKSINNSTFKNFQTANNKKVGISEAALAKSRQIFQDVTDDKSVAINTLCATTTTSSTFQGFQTASNKKVKISAEALEKSKKIFQEINEDALAESSPNSNTGNKDLPLKFKGFQTANNKEVKITAEALEKSKKIFQDIENDTHVESSVNPVDTIYKHVSLKFKGFQTANSKEVKISANALAKSKKIFQNINDDQLNNVDPCTVNTGARTSPIFKSFQTSSNRVVKVSKEAMAKSKELFHDTNNIDGSKNKIELERPNVHFSGFQTASNKNVKISDEAIARSRKIFQDLDLHTNRDTEASKSETSEVAGHSKLKDAGFRTASQNRVDISEDASTKSKKLFSENTEAGIKLRFSNKQKVSKINTENMNDVDTQLLNDFEESMREVTPKKSKRSGSPILSCPKAKKRKVFQIPYSQKSPKINPDTFRPPEVLKQTENLHSFSVSYKKVKMYNLKDLQRLEDTATGRQHIDPYIQKFDFENLLEFEFIDSRNDVSESVLTLSELKKIFLNSVNKKLVPEGWIEIQLKLILWKLLSYEIKFPKTMPLTCTAKNVFEQLKYRYEKELYNAERPALRKIFEKDDIASKPLVLCVVAIYDAQDPSLPPELLLTDGWYLIRAVIDKMLAKYVGNGKIAVGTKLVANEAELVGSEQAVAPWEDTSSIRLKIYGNSTRLARWDSRLGYHGNAAILSQLSTVAMDGGKVSKLRVFVTRVYPPLYVDKFEDGSTVTRSERLEHLHQVKFETERQALLERVYEDVEKEVMDQNSQDSEVVTQSGCKRKCLDSGSQIAKVMKRSRDPAEFRSHLTSTQSALLEDHTAKQRERLLQEIQTRVQAKMAAMGATLTRNVVTLFKVRVAGVEERRGRVEVTRAFLSIWRPNEATMEMIKENTWIEILNVVPIALRYSELHISAGRQSIFSQSKYKESEKIKLFTKTLKRTIYPIKDLVKNPAMTTDYNEIDTVGMIFEIDPAMNNFDSNKHQFQNVFLTDADKNIVSVNFWGGLKRVGFENVLETGQIVAGTNLQKRAGNSRKNIPEYRMTEFSCFTKTPKSETARKIIEELEQSLIKINKNAFCQECISLKNYFVKQKTVTNVTPYRFPNMDVNLSKNKIFIDSPIVQNNNKKDENLNLTGLDFDSTFKETKTQELSPKTLLRKRQVQERIAKLKRYGEPPPLSPMQIVNKSKNAANAYKSPLMSKSDVSPSVASSEKNLPKEEKCDASDVAMQCSPVINLNRTYVKRSYPVKLDFSKNENSISEAIDEFAEEFDCCTPLS